jgi:hypothetical protein
VSSPLNLILFFHFTSPSSIIKHILDADRGLTGTLTFFWEKTGYHAHPHLFSFHGDFRHFLPFLSGTVVTGSLIYPGAPDTLPFWRGQGLFIRGWLSQQELKLAGLPFVQFSYDQINIRTYVRDPVSGKKGVLFLFSGINSSFISIATNILGFPWKNISFVLETVRNKIDQSREIHAQGRWNGDIDIKLAEGSVSALSESFRDIGEYITSPSLGFYNVRGSALGFRVNHTKVRPRPGNMLRARSPFLVSSGLMSESEMAEPDNVLLADEAEFTIFLPPHKVTVRKDH